MNTPLTCQQIQQLIDEMSGSEIQDARHQGPVHEHAGPCPACRDHLKDALVLADHLNQWKGTQAQRNIAAAVMARIARWEQQKAVQTPGAWHRATHLLCVRVRIPVAAMIPVIAVLAVSLLLNASRLGRLSSASVAGSHKVGPAVSGVAAVDRQVQAPKLVYVTAPDSRTLQSFLARPEVSPSALIIVLGGPPIMPFELEPLPVRATGNSHPL